MKSRIVSLVLRYSRKQAFASPQNLHRWIAAARKTESHRPPAWLAARHAITTAEVNGFPVYEIAPAKGERRRILYLHGGAYVFEITSYHWALIAELARRTGFGVTVPIYPTAPEYDFHAMFAMVEASYRRMLAGNAARHIAFAGDSAGGNMAVVLTMLAARDGLPLPGRHVLISPGLDMSLSNPQIFAAERNDPWLAIPGGLEAIRLYSAGMDRRDWRISPLYGDLAVLPPTLLLIGSRDMLSPDNMIFAEKARAAGVDVELLYGQGMVHVWPLIDMPEARRARDRIVAYLKAMPSCPPLPGVDKEGPATAEGDLRTSPSP